MVMSKVPDSEKEKVQIISPAEMIKGKRGLPDGGRHLLLLLLLLLLYVLVSSFVVLVVVMSKVPYSEK